MRASDRTGSTALVTGASRGFGHAIASALHAEAGAVVAVARSAELLAALRNELGDRLTAEVADATDPVVVGSLIEQYRPDTLVLNAGAVPLLRPLQQQTWETFSVNWQTDVRIAFHWLREALLKPLRPGSRVVVVSSGAALNTEGSPLSGGYAGAKATQRFITGYAQDESVRAGLSVEEFLREQPFPMLSPAIAGTALVELAQMEPDSVSRAYVLNGSGLHKVG